MDNALTTKGLGEITSIDSRFIIDKDDRSITVSKGQTFVVKAENLTNMSSQVQGRCQDHPDNTVERFCTTCNKSVCKTCFMSCYKTNHDSTKISDAIDVINKRITELILSADDIKKELETTFHSIMDDKANFESEVQTIKEVIETHTEIIISSVKEESRKVLLDLENVRQQKNKAIEHQVMELESHQMEVQGLKASVTKTKNKPENIQTIDDFKSDFEYVKQCLKEMNSRYLPMKYIKPTFIINEHLDDVLTTKGLGEITSIDSRFIIDKGDRSITVSKGQTFVVKAESLNKSDQCKVAATLISPSGEKTATEVEDMGSGEYIIKGRCDKEGDWKMEVLNGVAHFKGSPVKIKVEPLGLVRTIEPRKYTEYIVSSVALGSDGCILVSSVGNDLLKFNKLGEFVANIKLAHNTEVCSMHVMGNGHLVYCDRQRNVVVMLNDKFEECAQFGKGILKRPNGLTVNDETRVLFVVDSKAGRVCKFNIDDGSFLGNIRKNFNFPFDVTLTREGNLMVTDSVNHRIQMFDTNCMFIKTLVNKGHEDGKVMNPCGIEMDMNENIIISSYSHKLQLFAKNGVFLKRIDSIEDGISKPLEIAVISNRPQQIAVADYADKSVKIFNY
ncbi:E3 ubiquitin-protein ligase TRIM71-like [Antedon mediterranea]|uniref:E3 ubiquitin-protein ligase TRIM71-like n=1 Tax=Antedon mediterranea TaxID=105859 RepID=UPI003AF467A1